MSQQVLTHRMNTCRSESTSLLCSVKRLPPNNNATQCLTFPRTAYVTVTRTLMTCLLIGCSETLGVSLDTHHRLHVLQRNLLPQHHLVKGADEEP